MDPNSTISDARAVAVEGIEPGPHLFSYLLSPCPLLAAIVGISIWKTFCDYKGNILIQAPFVGSRLPWFSRIIYSMDAKRIIDEGHRQFKNSVFKLCANDVVILPSIYLDELRNMSDDKASAILGLIGDAEEAFAIKDVTAITRLHTRIIQTRLNPKLGNLIPCVREELGIAFEKEFPECADHWTSVNAHHVFYQIVGRMSARILVGPELCRDEHWLKAVDGYIQNTFITVAALRLLPSWARWIVCLLLPSSWLSQYYGWLVTRSLTPVIARWQQENSIRQMDGVSTYKSYLQVMLDEAGHGPDSDSGTITKSFLSLTLASSHTTSMALVEAFYDLCAHPEYIEELREEVQQAVLEDGGWRKTTLAKMRKLDSFMKESQRVNPPSYSELPFMKPMIDF